MTIVSLQAMNIFSLSLIFNITVYRAESPEVIDKLSFDSPIMKELGEQVTIKSSLLRPYYSWYKELKERTSDDSEDLEDLPSKFDPENKQANYFLVTMDIGYEGIYIHVSYAYTLSYKYQS